MAMTTYSLRMDDNLKQQFDRLCEEFGMSATTAFNIYAKAVVREKKIPFEIHAVDAKIDELVAIDVLREYARANKLKDMTLDEINDAIRRSNNEDGK